MNAQSHDTPATAATDASALLGATLIVPLNRLKASPRNARKTPHATAAIEALAASIKAKGVLQPPVVEIERKADGTPSGAYLVTIGEGRRQALRLLAKRTAIKRTHPVRVTVDETNDAHEISLDENVTREAMHPADQFEAFRRVSEEKGWGAEEIGARFGVSAQVVRQRLRLGAVASELIAAYRAGDLSLEQLIAFGVSDDGVRQRQVFEQVGPHAPSHAIRRAMTETKVRADDRRARFVGAAAYEAAGGVILRDLFTEDGGGWLEDPALLDRLAAEKLADLAEDAREREGWAWAEAHADFPHGTGYGRVWPEPVERSEAEVSTIAALAEAYDAIIAEAGEDGLTPEQDARLEEIDNALQDHGPDVAYRPDDLCRSGLIVTLGHDGLARFERGLVRAEDALRPSDPDATKAGLGRAADADDATTTGDEARNAEADEERAPLSERLVMDLTAHRTAGLRAALAAAPTVALTAVVHALALQVFYPGHEQAAPLQVRLIRTGLERLAPGVMEGPAGRALAEQGEAWAARLPAKPQDLWAVLTALPGSEVLDLLTYCAALGLNAVRDPHDRRPAAWAQAEVLATALSLDMTAVWSPTAASYFSRVSKARMLEAVTEARDAAEAERIAGFRKMDMAEAAERLVEGTGWLPILLRTAPAEPDTVSEPNDASASEDEADSAAVDPDAYPFAAE
ncbi:ParB family chromosome partitioning protein [Brevundimonas nasdae]|uniref:ParB/RepB/Spo0J family partition protein n=1 Tax=Brevundimonas nasdae TaxID=172043 RepID=UPI001914D409|nr:ParB/RepB/Spo0J family partition protein [Brevundimonas nasdae]MBK6025816.1 ParB N-terminal domain-containing protein [Brevundimonas nasdae]MDQ0452331.1 ParB family chromosome partitioning protein [Brevundimonas nasdae]